MPWLRERLHARPVAHNRHIIQKCAIYALIGGIIVPGDEGAGLWRLARVAPLNASSDKQILSQVAAAKLFINKSAYAGASQAAGCPSLVTNTHLRDSQASASVIRCNTLLLIHTMRLYCLLYPPRVLCAALWLVTGTPNRECWHLLRGAKTINVRMNTQIYPIENGRSVANDRMGWARVGFREAGVTTGLMGSFASRRTGHEHVKTNSTR